MKTYTISRTVSGDDETVTVMVEAGTARKALELYRAVMKDAAADVVDAAIQRPREN